MKLTGRVLLVFSHLMLVILGLIPFIYYFLTEMPDSVRMSSLSEMGPLIEGENYRLQCDISNVAPVRNLSVHWQKGNKLLHIETFEDLDVNPHSVTSELDWKAHRDDDGTEIWCGAKLNFWPRGPELPLRQSESYKVNVLCKFLKPS